MLELPLSDATMSEVLARVAYRWIVYRYNRRLYQSIDPPTILTDIASELAWHQLDTLQVWVFAYRRLWQRHTSIKSIRDGFIIAARQGHSWRRVAFPQYKSQRRDPRVTNRGVARDGTTSRGGEE